ncbi:MAG TPA: nucleotidyltransferase family protein [Phenylobacterium sp.]|nr:nucleotidyltransferase family protein [Phenylobacterium sp.]
MIKQAVLLVGGLGTRLGERTRDVPKPLLDVAGRPFLSWLIDDLRRQGVSEILLLAGYHGHRVIEALGAADDIRILVEPEPLGTGGALRFAADHLDERFFFLNGDSFFDINLWDLAALATDGEAVLAVRPVEDASRYGRVVMDGARITGFAERSAVPGPGLINGGVGVFSRRIVERIPPGRAVSIEAEVYPLIASARLLFGRAYASAFIDIGVPEDLERAQRIIPQRMTRGAVILPRAALLTGSGADLRQPLTWRAGVPAAVKIVNDAGLLALLAADDLPADANGEENLQALRRRMNEGLCRYGAHIDGFAGDRQTQVAVTAEARVAEPGLDAEYILLGGHPRSPGGASNRQRVVYEDAGLIGAVSKLAAELG